MKRFNKLPKTPQGIQAVKPDKQKTVQLGKKNRLTCYMEACLFLDYNIPFEL